MQSSDLELLELWRSRRDAEAFAELVARHSAMVFGTCRRILRSSEAAEDVTQDCFLALCRANRRVGESLAGWLHSLATHRCLDLLKVEQRRTLREQRVSRERDGVDEPTQESVENLVDEAIAALPEQQRRLVVAHFLEGRTHREIGEALGLPRTTVSSRLSQGVALVRRHLARSGVVVSSVALGVLLTETAARAVPASLTAALGKLALAGGKPLLASAALTSGHSIVEVAARGGLVLMAKKLVLAVAAGVLCIAGWFAVRELGESGVRPPGVIEPDPSVATLDVEAVATGSDPSTESLPETLDETSTHAAATERTALSGEPASRPSRIAGQVLGIGGRPVEGARVLGWQEEDGELQPAREKTDAEGRFELPARRGRSYTVGAIDPGEGIGLATAIEADGEELILQLQPTSEIRGRVYDQGSDLGIAGVTVSAYPTRSNELLRLAELLHALRGSVASDRDGNYRLQLLAPELYRLGLSGEAGNYLLDDPANRPKIELEPRRDRDPVDFPLGLGVSIAGVVYSPAGDVVPGAEVMLIDQLNDQGGFRAHTRSDARGVFGFRGRRPGGAFVVRAAHDDFGTVDSEPVSIRGAGQEARIDVYFAATHNLRGRVVSSSGEGVDGLEVKLIASGGHRWRPLPGLRATSEASGHFAIPRVSAGEYQAVVFTAPATQVVSAAFTMPGDGDLGGLLIDIGFGVRGFIAGRITDPDGEPIPRVEVVAYSGNVTGVTDSLEDGSYRLEGLGGADTVTVTAKGFRTGHGRDQYTDVEVGSEDVDFVLTRDRSAQGFVVDAETGEPIHDFEVQWNRWGWESVHSPRGEFVFRDIKREEVVFSARAVGYATTTTESYLLDPGQSLENVTLRLEKGASVRGRVVDAETGEPLGDVRVKLFEGELRNEFLVREYGWGALDPISDSDGSFELGGLPQGRSVQVVAWRKDFAPAVELNMQVGDGKALEMRLGRGGRLVGTARRDREAATNAVLVCYRSAVGSGAEGLRYHTVGRIADDGSFSVPNLPPGMYAVTCYDLGTEEALWEDRVEIDDGQTHEVRIVVQ